MWPMPLPARRLEAGAAVCWFGADARLREVLEPDPAYGEIALGAQPIWHPDRWPEIKASKSSLRAQINRSKNKGVAVRFWPSDGATNHGALQRILDEWLASKALPALHFLVEPQTLDQLEDRRVFVATHGQKVVAFLIASPIPARQGWLAEQIIRGDGAPNGTNALLLDAAMEAARHSGAQFVTLGLSPLSDRVALPGDPHTLLRLLLGWTRAHGRRFYNFEGLERFKSKFVPDRWDAITALTNAGPLRTLYAIGDAFSGEVSPWGLLARALGGAVATEARTAWGRGAGDRARSGRGGARAVG